MNMKDGKLKQKAFYDKRFSSLKRAIHKVQNPVVIFYDKKLLRNALGSTTIDRNTRILEVGGGQGSDAIWISENAAHVVSIDLSSSALRAAHFISKMKNCENISFICGDAEHLPLKEGVFDIVFCKDLLHHVSNPLNTLREMRRIAKIGGKIIAIEANAINPQMILIGLIYFNIDKGVFKNTRTKLVELFLKSKLTKVEVTHAEFLPREIIFEYRSPFNKIIEFHTSKFLQAIKRIEENLQSIGFLKFFSNYLIVKGEKRKFNYVSEI